MRSKSQMFSFVLIISVVIGLASLSLAQNPLVLHHTFDDPNDTFGAGGTITDVTGNGWDGDVQVAITQSSGGVSGNAMTTAGTPYFDTALDLGTVAANNFAMSFWVNSTDKSANWQDWGRLTFSDGSDTDLAELRSPDSVNNWGFYWRDVNDANTSTVNGTVDIKSGDWHMVTIVVEPNASAETGYVTLYTDGGNVAVSAAKPARDATYSLSNLQIGRGQSTSPAGLLDDVQVYNTALSASDVAVLYANPGFGGTTFRQWDVGAGTSELTTAGNWLGIGTAAAPGETGNASSTNKDVAIIRGHGLTSGAGIDMDTAGGTLALGALYQNSGDGAVQLGNSSTTANGNLLLNGATVEGVANTVIRVGGTSDLTLADTPADSGSQTMGVVLGGATSVMHVDTDRTLTIESDVSMEATDATLRIQGGGATAISGAISGTGGVTQAGTGTLTFSGNNSYSGGTIVESGTLSASSSSALPSAGGISVAAGATAELAGTSQTYSFDHIAGAGTLDAGANALVAGADNSSAEYSVNITAGTLSKQGTGVLTLAGVNTIGGTTISGGKIRVGSSSSLGTGVVTLDGGELEMLGGVSLSNDIVLTGAAADNKLRGGFAPVEYLIVGGGGGGDDGESGESYGAGGGGGAVVEGVTADVAGNSYTMTVGSGGTSGKPITVAGDKATAGTASSAFGVTANGGQPGSQVSLAVGGVSGSGELGGVKSGVDSGGGGGAGGPGTNPQVDPNRKGGDGGPGLSSEITGAEAWYGGGGAGGISYPVGTNGGPTFGGIGGGGDYNEAGTSNSGGGGGSGADGGSGIVIARYLGAAVATGGTITSGTGSATGYTLHSFTSVGDATLSFGNSVNMTIAGAMSGTGGFTAATGAGNTLTLTAANSYSGDTVVESGTLALTGSGAVAGSATIQVDAGATLDVSGTSSTYQIGNGQTLTGKGTVTGALSMLSGSTLSPGASPGEMTINGDLSLDGADLLVDIWGDGGAGVADTGHDQITFTSGALSLANAPTITVDLNNFDPELDNSYTIITGIAPWTGDWGAVSVVNQPDSWTAANKSFRIDQGSVMLTVIPEPNTLGLLLVIGAAALLRRLRMR